MPEQVNNEVGGTKVSLVYTKCPTCEGLTCSYCEQAGCCQGIDDCEAVILHVFRAYGFDAVRSDFCQACQNLLAIGAAFPMAWVPAYAQAKAKPAI